MKAVPFMYTEFLSQFVCDIAYEIIELVLQIVFDIIGGIACITC